MKYRKKPVVIEAVQFNNSADIHEFCGDKVREPVGEDYLEVETLEGIMRANSGDYIIRGVSGEFYPCKPDIFEKTYEPVRHAHWTDATPTGWITPGGDPIVVCSHCGGAKHMGGAESGAPWKYCKDCGAKMDEVKDEN